MREPITITCDLPLSDDDVVAIGQGLVEQGLSVHDAAWLAQACRVRSEAMCAEACGWWAAPVVMRDTGWRN